MEWWGLVCFYCGCAAVNTTPCQSSLGSGKAHSHWMCNSGAIGGIQKMQWDVYIFIVQYVVHNGYIKLYNFGNG